MTADASIEVVEGIRVKHGVGRPRSRPREVHAGSAYDTKEVREYLRRGIKTNILVNQRNRRKPKRGRLFRLNNEIYKRTRSSVERFFARFKSFRRITTRYERLKTTFLGLIQIACILIHLRVLK